MFWRLRLATETFVTYSLGLLYRFRRVLWKRSRITVLAPQPKTTDQTETTCIRGRFTKNCVIGFRVVLPLSCGRDGLPNRMAHIFQTGIVASSPTRRSSDL